jgi:hypothetical protein
MNKKLEAYLEIEKGLNEVIEGGHKLKQMSLEEIEKLPVSLEALESLRIDASDALKTYKLKKEKKKWIKKKMKEWH